MKYYCLTIYNRSARDAEEEKRCKARLDARAAQAAENRIVNRQLDQQRRRMGGEMTKAEKDVRAKQKAKWLEDKVNSDTIALLKQLEKAYPILLDEYLNKITDLDNEFLDNLKIVNKSYLYYSNNLNPIVNYSKYKKDILCLPHYLVSLLLDEGDTFYEAKD